MSLRLKALLALALTATGCGTHLAPLAQRLPASTHAAAKAAPASYYAAAEGKQGQALLGALHDILVPHKDLGYDGARQAMFSEIDDPDHKDAVTCIYIGQTFPHVTNTQTAYQNGQGLNAEHTWPQSKGATGPAKADLHHLFPAQVHANGVRSSFPFGVVAHADWEEGGSKLGTDANGVRVFEPRDDHKGDTARALLYFYTVYGFKGNADKSNFKVEEPVMAAWCKADPVDAYEAKRNDAIYTAQGNRNPYIDRPEWVGTVGKFLP